MLVKIIPERFQLVPRPADEWTGGGRPSVEVNGDEMTQLFAGSLSQIIRTFQAKEVKSLGTYQVGFKIRTRRGVCDGGWRKRY